MLSLKFRAGGSEKQRISDPPLKALKFSQTSRFSLILKLNHRALGMSDFDVRHGIGKEIVCTFRFYYHLYAPFHLHTCGTQKAHR